MMKLSLPSVFTFPVLMIDKNKTEFEIFFSNFRAVNHEEIIRTMANDNEVVKSVHLSKINRQKGNEAYSKLDFKKALELYYLSLAYAPYDSVEYGFAIANRIAALFSMKRYEECLKDVENIWDTNYPEQQLYKIYIRQSVCFLMIKQYSKAFECNVKARENSKKFENTISQAEYNTIQKKINKIFTKIKPYDANTTEYVLTEPELKDGENPKFLNASNVVDLKYNDTVGRYVVSKTDILKGDILFVEEPYSAIRVNDLTYRYTYCSNCLVYNPATIPCHECIVNFYCSHNCKQLSWNKGHKWECYGERKQILRPAMRLPLNIMFKAAQNNFKTVVEDESVYGNKDDNFAFVDKLATNKNKMTKTQIRNFTKLSIWLVIYLKEYTNFFNWFHEQPNNSEKSMSELFDLIGGILLKLCMQIQCNNNDIVDISLANLEEFNLDFDFIGFGLYVSSSMVNHSCVPNALVSFNQSLKIIRATKNIKKDTEITINYTNFINKVRAIDSSFLLDNYNFDCTCVQCTQSLSTSKKLWMCYKCQGKAFNLNEAEAKCLNCQEIFSTVAYKHIESLLFSSYLKAFTTGNARSLDSMLLALKTIYHPEHEEYSHYYMLTYDFYIAKQDACKCLHICKTFVQYCENSCDNDLLKLQAYLRLMNATAIYHGLMQHDLVPLIHNLENYFCEILDKTTNLLKFFVSAENIKIYDSCFRNYLMTYN